MIWPLMNSWTKNHFAELDVVLFFIPVEILSIAEAGLQPWFMAFLVCVCVRVQLYTDE